jgi:hypothetical protein
MGGRFATKSYCVCQLPERESRGDLCFSTKTAMPLQMRREAS